MESQRMTFEEELQQHGQIVYRNTGVSMMPMLRQNRDLLVVKPRGAGRCKRGDVVLYKRGEDYILHRVIKVLPEGYIIWGDHNRKRDPVVYDDQILGILSSFVRDGKEIAVDEFSYRLYSGIWTGFVIPMRSLAVWGKRKIRRIRDHLLR